MNKILLLCVTSQSIVNFRASLIKKLQSEGYSISAVAFDSLYKDEIDKLGIDFYTLEDNNRSLNPLKILTLRKRYKKIIQKIKPDKVFTFMLKPNVFGVKGAKSAGVKEIYSMVEGAGDAFIRNSFKWKVIRFVICKLYKGALKSTVKTFFLNNDDLKEFVDRGLIKYDKCELIHGIGVDLCKFEFKPLKNYNVFLMVARMLETKGVYEYLNAARLVKQKYPDAVFNYLGGEGTVTVQDIKEYIEEGTVNYLGTAKDVRPYLEDCTAFVLPSYREGVSMSTMEAEAIGRIIITTQTVGCRETVEEGYNGYLVEKHNSEELAQACIKVIENKDKAIEMGKNSRAYAENKFDQIKINDQIIEVIGN